MEHIIEDKKIGVNVSIKVLYDENALNPRTNHEILWKIFQVGYSKYDLGDDKKIANFFDEGELFFKRFLKGQGLKKSDCIVVPLYLFQHRVSKIERTKSDRFDSGFLGFAYVSKKSIREWYSTKKLNKDILVSADELLNDEIYKYNMFINSEIMKGILYETSSGDEITEYYEFYLEDANDVINEVIEQSIDDDLLIKDEVNSSENETLYEITLVEN